MSLKIAYVDDEVGLCEVFKDVFETKDVSILTYFDARSAIAGIETNPPDLIFLDYRLPGITGDQIAQKLDQNIPKVLITGDLSVSPTSRFLRIFQKPFQLEDMRDFISEQVEAKKSA